MGIFLVGTLNELVRWLALHHDIAYGVLFVGAYFETLIGTCFFIPGDAFFLAGAILAGHGILAVSLIVPLLYAAALFGDSTSYFLGRLIQGSVFKEGRTFLNLENYQKGHQLFLAHGPKVILFARFLGPISWLIPFLSGVYKVPYKTFIKYNIPAVLLGVGQYLAIGYFFGYKYQFALWFVERYLALLLLVVLVIVTSHWYVRRRIIT